MHRYCVALFGTNPHTLVCGKQYQLRAVFPILVFIALIAVIARAQSLPATTDDDQMGLVPYVSYHGGDIDNVNLATGNLTIRMPFLSYPQRGNALKVEFELLYNGKPYQYQQINCPQGKCIYEWVTSGLSPGWSGMTPTSPSLGINVVDADAIKLSQAQSTILHPPDNPDYTNLFKIITADNASHLLGLVLNTGGDCGSASSGWEYSDWGTFETLDATGWQMDIPSCGAGTTAVINPTGVRYSFDAGTRTDPNGNYLTVSSTNITDTLGRVIPLPTNLTSASTSLCPTSGPLTVVSASYWSPPGYGGTTLNYLFCYADISINIPPYSSATAVSTTVPLLQSITLPNSTYWTFAYGGEGGTYNNNPINYGDLTQITLPTGGTISYGYTIYGGASSYGPWVSSRTVNANDGTGTHTWTYAYGYTGSGQQTYPQTIVTDPLGNDTAHTFGLGLYETSGQYYQGSHTSGTLLKTVATTYDYFANKNSSVTGYTSTVPTQITTTWAINSQVSQLSRTYDTNNVGFSYVPYCSQCGLGNGTALYGKITSQIDYDYGSGAHGSALRTTNTSYMWQNNTNYLTNNLLDRQYSVQVLNGSNAQQAYTYYGYDESGLIKPSPSVSEQFSTSDAESPPGNQTSVHRWLNGTSTVSQTPCSVSVSSGGYLSSTKIYYNTGEIQSTTDPCGYQTTYQYTSTSPYYGGYLTTVTNALGQVTTYGYDSTTGLVTSITDPNSQTTNKTYDPLTRLLSVSYPDGGSTSYCYTDMGGSTCTQAGAPYEVVVTKAITSSPKLNETSTLVVDGLGRLSQTQLNSDPSGVTYVDTTYDADGRKYTVSNPHRSGSSTTDGITTYVYDALSRVCVVGQPDGPAVSQSTVCPTTALIGDVATQYTANCTTAFDEVGNARESCVDGLGRITSVIEDPGSSPHLNYTTTYTYNALADLTGVAQNGSRSRTFTYDSLSHLLSSQNPESGTISYAYDADGNVITKTAPLQNQSGSLTVTATSTYDELNRTTQKSYMDGSTADPYTPTIQFGYDGNALSNCTIEPPNETDDYPIGRETAMCDGSGADAFKFDTMGRVLQERRTIGKGITNYVTYAYNLDGSMRTLITPPLKVLNYTYGGDGRLTQLTDSSDGLNFALGATYAPPGELVGMTLGSGTGGFAGFNISNAYNERLQPILLSAANGSTSVFSECFDFHLGVAITSPSPCSFSKYTTGDNGNVYQIVNNRSSSRTQLFAYDSLNRIASAESNGTGSTSWGDTYVIDAWGNLTNMNPISGQAFGQNLQASPANAQNQLPGFGYDAAGNLTSNGTATYTYDAENRLVYTSGYRYIYDANGERVEKCQATSATEACPTSGTSGTLYWRGTGSDTLAETDLGGNDEEEYLFFGGQRIARRDVTDVNNVITTVGLHYYFSDHLGSHGVVETVNLTSGAASCDQDIDYYPYGGVENDYCANVTQNYKFTGKERDSESGLDNFDFRYYASSLGRFMKPDDSLVYWDRSDPQSLNLYSYAENNPVSNTDPDGHDCVYLNNSGSGVESIDQSSSSGECGGSGGYWVQGAVTNAQINGDSLELTGTTNGVNNNTSASYLTNGDVPLNPFAQQALGQAGVLAAPGVNLAAKGLEIFGWMYSAPAMLLATCASGGPGCNGPSAAMAILPEVGALREGAVIFKEGAAFGKGAEILQKAGGMAQAAKDYESLQGAEAVYGSTKVKTLADGTKAVLYNSTGGSGAPTLAFQDAAGRTLTKIRY